MKRLYRAIWIIVEAGRVISTRYRFKNLDERSAEESSKFHQRHVNHTNNRVHLKDHLPKGVVGMEEALAHGNMLGVVTHEYEDQSSSSRQSHSGGHDFGYLIRVLREEEICLPQMLTSPS